MEAEFRIKDPKGVFEAAMKITSNEKREDDLANLVKEAPLPKWLSNSSFERFYKKIWDRTRQFPCQIENLYDRQNS